MEILEGELDEDETMIEVGSSDDEGGNLDGPAAAGDEGQCHKRVPAGADRRLGGGGKAPGVLQCGATSAVVGRRLVDCQNRGRASVGERV